MNAKTKDRLMTAGAVALICLGGFSTSGCATQERETEIPISIQRIEMRAKCETDMECEMLSRAQARAGRRDSRERFEWTWQKVTAAVLSIAATGWIIAERQSRGNSSGALVSAGGTDKSIQPVNCVAKGCAL